MGKTVYKIEIVNKSPYKDEIIQTTKELEELKREGEREPEAAEKAVKLADLILQDLEHSIHDQTIDPQKYSFKAAKYCKYAYKILLHDAFRNTELLLECLKYWIDALTRLEQFDKAIDISKEYVTLLSDVNDLTILHEAYHEIAGLYFIRGHNEEIARYNDFDNARRFYDLERRVLDQLPENTEYLEDLKRSSDLNMAIIGAKEFGGLERAQMLFARAYKTAIQLDKHEERQTTAWEIGNAHRNHGDLEKLSKAQKMELKIIRQYEWKDKEIICRFEIARTHLERGLYDECRKIVEELEDLVDTEALVHDLHELQKNISRIESFRIAISKLPDAVTLGLVHRRAALYFELGRTEFEQHMLHTALASTRNGISEIKKDPGFTEQLAGLLISLKQLEADILWKIRQSSIEELHSLNEEILVDIKLHFDNKQQRLEHAGRVYCRLADLFYYFEQQSEYEKWEGLYDDCKKVLKQYEEKDETMDLDYYNEDEELNEAIASMDISASAGIKEGDITQKKDPILTVRVAVNINHQEKILFIQVFNDTKCIDWLMEQVAQKVWESYGYEPKIYELKTEASGCLLPQELVVVAIQGNFELVHAYYHGFREKTPLEVYQNSCSRNKVSTRHTVELALHENEQTDALVLADTCLVSRDIPVICDLLSHIKPVTKVDLSGNVLYDHDIADLFKHIQDLHEVDLSSNRITSKTIAKLAYHPNLRRASLSYNPLGSDTLALLPELLRKCSHLDVLDLESCDVDNYTLQDITLHEYRHYSGHRLESLNLSNNALIRDSTSFERWKPLLHNLVNHPTNIEF